MRKLMEKRSRYTHHLRTYNHHLSSDTSPKGLTPKTLPALGELTRDLKRQWDSTIRNTSRTFLEILKEQCHTQLESIQADINHISLTDAEANSLHTHIERFEHLLLQKERSKLRKLNSSNAAAPCHTNSAAPPNRDRATRSHTMTAQNHGTTRTANPDTVIDISRSLSSCEVEVLSKGLTFCPTLNTVSEYEIHKDISDFARRLRIREYFGDTPQQNNDELRAPSDWTPNHGREPALDMYIKLVTKDIIQGVSTNKHDHNLTSTQRNIVKTLANRDDIVIKPADKGGSIVIWPTKKYISEAHRQLGNTQHYLKLDHDPTKEYTTLINNTLRDLYDRQLITRTDLDYLTPTNTNAGRFYLLPKIHKLHPSQLYTADIPGRPIVSNNNTPTERLSKFLDHHLKHIPTRLPSHVQDTPHLLRIIRDLNNTHAFDNNTILATLDVTSLYTNIPHSDGITSLRDVLRNPITKKDPQALLTLIDLVLKYNYFEFNNEYFLQIHGTSMGTPVAPTYANIFMGTLENKILANLPHKPTVYLRYIDDIFIIWEHGEQQFHKLVTLLNNAHATIKFTSEHSTRSINFLDTSIILENGKLTTTLYKKPTDKQQYLHFHSHHPRHCKVGIPSGQSVRLRRICSNDSDYTKRVDDLCDTLTQRDYPQTLLNEFRHKALALDRNQVLEPRKKTDAPLINFITKYSNGLPNVKSILRKYEHLLQSNDRLKRIFNFPVQVTYRRGKNLGDTLVNAKLNKNSPQYTGARPCNLPRCKTCKHIQTTNCVKSTASAHTHTIKHAFTCTSSNVIYCIECGDCSMQYIGETGQQMNNRLTGHRTDTLNKLPKAVSEHFNAPGHSFERIRLYILETGFRSTRDRRDRESFLIHKFKSIHPYGINKSKGTLETLYV